MFVLRLPYLSGADNHLPGAGNGSRTRNPQLGSLMLYQLSYSRHNRIRIKPAIQEAGSGPFCSVVEGGGFEPPKASPTDLQSVPFDRSGTPPCIKKASCSPKALTTFMTHSPNRPALLPAWSWRWDLNPQPADYKSAALPIELRQPETGRNRQTLMINGHLR